MDGVLVNSDIEISNFLILASILFHTLNIVLDSDHSGEKNITQIVQSCEKLVIMQAVRQVKMMVSKENFKLVSQFQKMCQYFAS